MQNILLVAMGGALGSSMRYLAGIAELRLFGAGFPWGTLSVNILGSFLMGLFMELLTRRFGGSEELRLLIATGFLGGFTTFSSFSLDFAELYGRDALAQAAAYLFASLAISISAVFIGMWLGKSLG